MRLATKTALALAFFALAPATAHADSISILGFTFYGTADEQRQEHQFTHAYPFIGQEEGVLIIQGSPETPQDSSR